MPKNLITIVLLIFCYTASSQELHLDLKHKKLRDFVLIQQSAGNKPIPLYTSYMVASGIAQPVAYVTHQDNVPDMVCYCFYRISDSTITSLEFTWDKFNLTGKVDMGIATRTEVNALIDKYKEVYKQLELKWGKSESTGDLNNQAKIDSGKFEKYDSWQTNDSIAVDLHMNLFKGNMYVLPAYNITLDVEFAKAASEIMPSDANVAKADSLFKLFLHNVKNKKYNDARMLLSASFRNNVTDDQLIELSKNVNFNDKIDICMSGVQMALTGKQYLMVQYKYHSDNNSPPLKLIKVIFDTDNTLLGIQPISRL